MRLPIGPGIDSIPTDTIPSDPEQFVAWFKSVGLKRWFANADVRNAQPGAGISITGSLASPATIAVNSEFQALFAQPYVLQGSPIGAPLTDYRTLEGESGVVSVTDGGPEEALTIGLENPGLTALIEPFTATLSGAVPPPVTPAGNFLRDDGTWDAAGGGSQFIRGAGWASAAGSIPVAFAVPIDVVIPYDCVLQEVYITTQGGTGSCTVDVWKTPIGSFPPTVANDITSGVPPSILTSSAPYTNTTLTGWTTAFAQNDVIRFTLASNAFFTSVEIQLRMK